MKYPLIALSAALLSLSAHAQVTVDQAWVRATVPAQKSSGAFMTVTSASDAKLVGVSSPVAGMAELHQMEMQNGTMRMHHVDAVDLPAGKAVDLSAGYHVMLMDLKRQLKDGETVPVTLVVEGKGKKRANVTVQVPVKPITTTR